MTHNIHSFSKQTHMSKASIFPSLTGITESDKVCDLLKVNKEEGRRANAGIHFWFQFKVMIADCCYLHYGKIVDIKPMFFTSVHPSNAVVQPWDQHGIFWKVYSVSHTWEQDHSTKIRNFPLECTDRNLAGQQLKRKRKKKSSLFRLKASWKETHWDLLRLECDCSLNHSIGDSIGSLSFDYRQIKILKGRPINLSILLLLRKKKDSSLKCNKNIHVCKWCLILRQAMRVRKSECKKKHDILMFPLMFLSCSVFICQRKLHGAMLSTCPCSQNTVFMLTSLK